MRFIRKAFITHNIVIKYNILLFCDPVIPEKFVPNIWLSLALISSS